MNLKKIKGIMVLYAKSLYRIVVPQILRNVVSELRFYEKHKFKMRIIQYLKKELKTNPDSEKQEVLDYLRKNVSSSFPYNFGEKKEKVFIEGKCLYVMYDGKKMYFPDTMTISDVQNSYMALIKQININSPHRYQYGEFQVLEGDVVFDLGAAEGIFALTVIDKCKKVYLFEPDEKWLEPLALTFAPWKDKVTIINKFISDCNDDKNIRLDDFLVQEKTDINFIKADLEGMEAQFLEGAQHTLATPPPRNDNDVPLRIAICTYHKSGDAEKFNEVLSRYGFRTEFSRGYYINFQDDNLPYLRRGLLRGTKAS